MQRKQAIGSFFRTLGQAENRKGYSAEDKVLDALLFYYNEEPWIAFSRRATREEDLYHGIDIVVETRDIGKLFLQIKSSQIASRKYSEKRRRTMIAVVVVKPHETREFIWSGLKKALGDLRSKILDRRCGR